DVVPGLMKFIGDHKLPLEVHYAGGLGGVSGLTPNSNLSVPWLVEQMQKGQNLLGMTPSHTVAIEGVVIAESADGTKTPYIYFRHDPNQNANHTQADLDASH